MGLFLKIGAIGFGGGMAVIALSLLLSGCTVGPDFEKPASPRTIKLVRSD